MSISDILTEGSMSDIILDAFSRYLKCVDPSVSLTGVSAYINRVDPYAYKDPKIESTGFSVHMDDLSVLDRQGLAVIAGLPAAADANGMVIKVSHTDLGYDIRYTPNRSKDDALKKFEEQYRQYDPALMDAIADYFLEHEGTHLYADEKNGRIHYGVLQDDDGVYEGTVKL